MSCSERYSKALFRLSPSDKELEKRCQDLNQIMALFNQNPSFLQFFTSHQITQEVKEKALRNSLGKFVDKELLAFFLVLIKKRRFQFLPEIVSAYTKRVMDKIGTLHGRLIMAKSIPNGLIEILQKKLENIFQKKVVIEEEIDSRLIGGGMLKVGNQLADFSIKGKLLKLKNDLLSINV